MNGMYESLPLETKNLSWDEYKASKEECRTYPQVNYENSIAIDHQKKHVKTVTEITENRKEIKDIKGKPRKECSQLAYDVKILSILFAITGIVMAIIFIFGDMH
ncbi:MAG: hypothetical protein WC998_04925 [Candidatus Paceibacterota bacterium]|jgi:hypothetical protein